MLISNWISECFYLWRERGIPKTPCANHLTYSFYLRKCVLCYIILLYYFVVSCVLLSVFWCFFVVYVIMFVACVLVWTLICYSYLLVIEISAAFLATTAARINHKFTQNNLYITGTLIVFQCTTRAYFGREQFHPVPQTAGRARASLSTARYITLRCSIRRTGHDEHNSSPHAYWMTVNAQWSTHFALPSAARN